VTCATPAIAFAKGLIPYWKRTSIRRSQSGWQTSPKFALAEEDLLGVRTERVPLSDLFRQQAACATARSSRRLVRAAATPGPSSSFASRVDFEVVEGTGDAPATCNLQFWVGIPAAGDVLVFVPPEPQEGAAKGLPGPILNALRLPIPGEVSDLGTGRRFQARRILLANPQQVIILSICTRPHALPSELS